jgi:hypothetical protein
VSPGPSIKELVQALHPLGGISTSTRAIFKTQKGRDIRKTKKSIRREFIRM